MSLIHVSCELTYQVKSPTSFLFNVSAANTRRQKIQKEEMWIEPVKNYDICYLGSEDNRAFRFKSECGDLSLHYEANVRLNPEIDSPPQIGEKEHPELPEEALPYLNPSRYCESDLLGNFAIAEFGRLERGYRRVDAIRDWTHEHLRYQSSSTNASTTACDVLIQRTGVCRDYAHLAIAICRALCIPARYVSGYAVGLEPPDFHGFFEAYLGDRWYLFDATRLAPVEGLVRIGMGRDAADVPFATLIGEAVLKRKSVKAQELTDEISHQVPIPEPAVSTA